MMEKSSRNGQTASQDELPHIRKDAKGDALSVSNTPRKRVSQACDRCRSRKDKCDGKKPVCSTCAALDQVCSYDPSTKKRGLPEGYVRGLEKLWGLTIREADGIEDTVLEILGGGADTVDIENIIKVWNDRDVSETLLETWRKSRISRELERLLPLLDIVEEKPGKRKRPESGFSKLDSVGEASKSTIGLPSATLGTPFDAASGNHDDSPPALSFHGLQRRRIDDLSPEWPNSVYGLFELPSRAWHLIDVFFAYTHCWFPIIEKHDLLRTSYQYSQKPAKISTTNPGSGDHAALWAVLAYADFQNRIIAPKDPPPEVQWSVDDLYRHARSLIPSEEGHLELGHVQALLVLTLLNMGRNQWDRAWLLVGQAVRVAINLGVDEGPNERSPHSKDNKARSRHVFLGCFVLDTIIAARLGRTPQLRREDADRVGPIEEDGLDEWSPWMDCLEVRRVTLSKPQGPTAILSTFNQLIVLFKILNSVISDVSPTNRRVETCSKLLGELDSWGEVLPALLAPNPTGEPRKPPLLPHRYHLHVAHMSAIAAVYNHLSPYKHEMEITSQTVKETLATTACQTMWLFLRQLEGFGLLIAPPTYDYFAKIACESGYKVPDVVSDETTTYNDWERNMERSLTSMEKVWPTFAPLRTSLTARIISDTPKYQSPNVPIPTTEIFSTPQHIPSHAKLPSVSEGMFGLSVGLGGTPMAQRDIPGSSHSNLTPAQLNPLLALSDGAHLNDISSPTWPDVNPQNPFLELSATDALQVPERSFDADIDDDTMFNDFATLDAMEWTNNWDQSLMNLGFTDLDNMNQDFYAFCREPDPLYSNNLVQQLLSSNSNGETGGGSFNMSGMGIRGMGFSNPHVEASQILQALSAQGQVLGEGRV